MSGKTKGPVCGVENCRSRIYEEAEDGYLYCQNGHRRGELVAAKEDDEYRVVRRDVSRKQIEEYDVDKQYKYYRGHQGFDLYLKSTQLLLRHQVWFLIQQKGLPTELENVVCDLWALRILQLENRISGTQTFDSNSQAYSTDGTGSESEGSEFGNRKRSLKSTPHLIDCLALCYLGVVTLRIPTTPGDFIQWITDAQMPYRRAIKYLPSTMRDRLPPSYRSLLDPNAALRPERLMQYVIRSATNLGSQYGISWPKLNLPLLLFRLLQDLALPLELYDASVRLSAFIGYDLALPSGLSGNLDVIHIPEAQLLACLIVCIKLMHPFNRATAYPKTVFEPAATSIDWNAWYHAMQESKKNASNRTHGQLTDTREKDVFTMSAPDLDQYLDWYQDTFVDDAMPGANDDGFHNSMLKMFPVDRERPPVPSRDVTQHTIILDKVKAVHATMKPREVVPEYKDPRNTQRPGQMYERYKKVEDLPTSARRFYEEAAGVMGLSLSMVVRAVWLTERKMEKRMAERL